MINEIELKEKLLATNIFKQNDYFTLYIELILNNIDNKKEIFITESHHILPKSYFKACNIKDKKIINSKDNLVNLTEINHVLAHWYLYNCIENIEIKNNNLIAVMLMLNENNLLNIEQIIKNKEFDSFLAARAQWKELVGSKRRGKKYPEISKWLKEHHFDCSGGLNSRATSVFIFDLKNRKLINSFKTKKDAEEKLEWPGLRVRLTKNKIGIRDKIIVCLTKELDNSLVDKELERIAKIKNSTRYEYKLKCDFCGNIFYKKLRVDQYQYKINNHSCCCAECNKNGKLFKNTRMNDTHRIKISNSSKGRKWINNGIEARQLKEPELTEFINKGWQPGQLKRR